MNSEDLTFAQAMKKLEEINNWFQHEDIDLDKGLEKLREGKAIIDLCRKKLKTVENEFIQIKEEYEDDEGRNTMHPAPTDGITTSVIETHEETVITTTTDEISF